MDEELTPTIIRKIPKELDMSPERFVFFFDELKDKNGKLYYQTTIYSKDLETQLVVVKTRNKLVAEKHLLAFEDKLERPDYYLGCNLENAL